MKLNKKTSGKAHYLYYIGHCPIITILLISFSLFSKQLTASAYTNHIFQKNLVVYLRNEQISDTSNVIDQVDSQPQYPGGETAIILDICKYLQYHYPNKARLEKIQGTVEVHFIVETDGSISTIEVRKGKDLGGGLAKTAINAVKSLKKFNPGMNEGVPVRVSYMIPVTFRVLSI